MCLGFVNLMRSLRPWLPGGMAEGPRGRDEGPGATDTQAAPGQFRGYGVDHSAPMCRSGRCCRRPVMGQGRVRVVPIVLWGRRGSARGSTSVWC